MLGVSRASLHRATGTGQRRGRMEPPWLERLRYWIQQHPTFGYRRLWVLLRFRDGLRINRKAVYRVLKQNGWFVHQRVSTPPRRTRRNRMGSSNGSFGVSKRNVSGNTRSRRLRRRGGSFGTGCGGTTKSARIKRWAIEAQSNIGRNNQPRWLDFRGALQPGGGNTMRSRRTAPLEM